MGEGVGPGDGPDRFASFSVDSATADLTEMLGSIRRALRHAVRESDRRLSLELWANAQADARELVLSAQELFTAVTHAAYDAGVRPPDAQMLRSERPDDPSHN